MCPTATADGESLTIVERAGAPAAAVWEMLTARRSEWWPEMHLLPVVGAAVHETWVEDGVEESAQGVVVEATEGELLVFEWSSARDRSTLRVRIQLADVVGGTLLKLTESGFAGDDDRRAEHEHGWRFHLGRLMQALAP